MRNLALLARLEMPSYRKGKRSLDHMVRDPELIGELSETLARKIGPEIKKVFTHVGLLGFEAFIIIGYDAMRGDFFGPHRDNLAPKHEKSPLCNFAQPKRRL